MERNKPRANQERNELSVKRTRCGT